MDTISRDRSLCQHIANTSVNCSMFRSSKRGETDCLAMIYTPPPNIIAFVKARPTFFFDCDMAPPPLASSKILSCTRMSVFFLNLCRYGLHNLTRLTKLPSLTSKSILSTQQWHPNLYVNYLVLLTAFTGTELAISASSIHPSCSWADSALHVGLCLL